MQSSGTVPQMPLPENLRRGQKEVIEKFYTESSVIAKLPTGYGKTIAAAGSYAVLKNRGIVNRMLYIVPRRNQAIQAANGIPADLEQWFGIETKSTIIGDERSIALIRHRNNTCEIFITTIQGLATSPPTNAAIESLTSNGNWFVVIDEYHNIPGSGEWIKELNKVPFAARLMMSATPRLDEKDPFGDADVSVSYFEAYQDGCVKEMHLHEYEYRVDAVTIDGNVISFSTGDLFDSEEDIERMMSTKKMRWSPKYISPLVSIPAERIADSRLRGVRTQMLIQAMTCTHAEMVCQQVKALLPTLGVEWVGTGPNGRSQADNDRILDQFCPEKDAHGKRNWTLDVLVNVGIAGEGLDTQDVTEIVFLTPVNKTVSNLQTMGRASRIMFVPNDQPIACINVDTDTFISLQDKYVGKKIMGVFDNDETMEEIKKSGDEHVGSENEYQELPDQPIVVIKNVKLVDVRKEPGFDEMFTQLKASEGRGRTDEECEELVIAGIHKYYEERDKKFNATSERAQLKQSVDQAVGKITGLIARRMSLLGLRIEKSFFGDVKKRINGKKKKLFGRLDECDSSELRKQWDWLKQLEREILMEDNVQGVPSWLR